MWPFCKFTGCLKIHCLLEQLSNSRNRYGPLLPPFASDICNSPAAFCAPNKTLVSRSSIGVALTTGGRYNIEYYQCCYSCVSKSMKEPGRLSEDNNRVCIDIHLNFDTPSPDQGQTELMETFRVAKFSSKLFRSGGG